MMNDADDGPDTGVGPIPDVADIEEEVSPDWKPAQDLLYTLQDGEPTVIVEDQTGEAWERPPLPGERPGLKAETLETKHLDAQFAAQVEDATERYQRSLGDVTAGFPLDATPDLGQASEVLEKTLEKTAEAMNRAVRQLLEHWNANRR